MVIHQDKGVLAWLNRRMVKQRERACFFHADKMFCWRVLEWKTDFHLGCVQHQIQVFWTKKVGEQIFFKTDHPAKRLEQFNCPVDIV